MRLPTAVLLLCTISVAAPLDAAADPPPPVENMPRITYAVRLGVGLSGVPGTGEAALASYAPGRLEADLDDSSTRTLLSAGAGMTVWLGRVNLAVEATFARRGADFSYLDGRGSEGLGPLDLYYVELPVLARLESRGRESHGFAVLGLQPAFLVVARISDRFEDESLRVNNARRFDVAVVGGAGFIVPSTSIPDLLFELRLAQGLVPVSSETDEGRNRYGLVSIGLEWR